MTIKCLLSYTYTKLCTYIDKFVSVYLVTFASIIELTVKMIKNEVLLTDKY